MGQHWLNRVQMGPTWFTLGKMAQKRGLNFLEICQGCQNWSNLVN